MHSIAAYLHVKEDSPEEEYGSETLWNLYVEAMSEVGDVVYNLAKLVYKDDAKQKARYKNYIQDMAQTLGLDPKDLLLLSVLKFTLRLKTHQGKKNSVAEHELMSQEIRSGIISRPSDEDLNELHDELDLMQQELKPRILRIEKENRQRLFN